MNQIAIAIKLNERQVIVGVTWPTKTTLKALGCLKLGRLKCSIQQAAFKMAMAIIPLPQCAAA